MTKLEYYAALRQDPSTHYNCAQSVLIPFAGELGLTPEQARALTAHFGGGMGCGSTCGAIAGALMALGGLGLPKDAQQELLDTFRAEHGALHCSELTAELTRGTPEHFALCDGLIEWCVRFVCRAAGLE